MTLRDKRDKEVREALEIETRPLFPAIYEGFIEADALAQGEDAILRVLRNAIYQYFQNRNLQTLKEEAAYALESGLGLAHSGTIEERRAALIEAINKRFVMNEATLAERIERMANGEDVRFRIDPQALTLEIWTQGGENDGEFVAYDITQALMPIIPQNLQLCAEIYTDAAEIEERETLGAVCAIACSIETETIENTPCNETGVFVIWLESYGSVKMHVIKAIKDFLGIGLADAKTLAEAAPTEIARYDNRADAETALNTLLSTNNSGTLLRDTDAEIYIKFESGTGNNDPQEEENALYDVWIENVDTSNNVVVALRTVFSGLTAARANTIINNAPVPLSRYNSYLNQQGGPFAQTEATALKDRLQAYIPQGDGSLFGIRQVEE